MVKEVTIPIPAYEVWIPWIIGFVILLIIFPYEKIRNYLIPDPIIQYVEVPQYIYVPAPVPEVKEHFEEPVMVEPPEPIICVFDIISNEVSERRCVKMCKDMGCMLAINTVRDIDNTNDLNMEELGFVDPHFNKDDYYFNPNSKTSNFDEAAGVKVEHLNTIKNKYGITDPKRVLLFDDNIINITDALEHGFSCIQLGTKNPGIEESDIVKAHSIIQSLS